MLSSPPKRPDRKKKYELADDYSAAEKYPHLFYHHNISNTVAFAICVDGGSGDQTTSAEFFSLNQGISERTPANKTR